MKTQQIFIVLTVVNVAMTIFSMTRPSSVAAQDVAPVLRGRALEIVDERGHVRAEIKIFPADPKVKMPDGTTGYPETVLLRLLSSKNAPNVKLSATEDGSGMVLGGEPGYVQILGRGANPLIKLSKKGGREQTILP